MKKILDFLRKIGLLHASKGDYMTGAFDDRKSTKKDFKLEVGGKKYSKTTLKIGLWLMLLIGGIVVILSLMVLGFILMFLVIFAIWLWLAFWVKQKIDNGGFKHGKLIVIFITVVVITVILVLVGVLTGENTNTNSSTNDSTRSSQEQKQQEQDTVNENKTVSHMECAAKNMKKSGNEFVSLKMASIDNPLEDKTASSYEKGELINLSYGYAVQGNDSTLYVAPEVCKGDISISRDGTSLYTEYEPADPEMPYTSTNMINFSTEEGDSIIKEQGEYTVYIYVSSNGSDWSIAGETTFGIK